MFTAGVGAPDDTYAIVCEPQPGTDLDMHEIQPWKRDQRKSVRLIDPADRDNLQTPCFHYDAVPGDTAASIADAFLVDVRRFIQNNTQVFKPLTVSTSLNESLTEGEVTAILSTIKGLQQFPGATDPYLRCTDTTGGNTECRIGGAAQPCAGRTNCTLFYQEPDVSLDPAGQVLRICDINSAPGQFETVARFTDPTISQPRTLRRLLDEWGYKNQPVPRDYCNPNAWDNPQWVQSCADGWITTLSGAHGVNPNAKLNRNLAELLLTFARVELLSTHVASGSTIPPQLGGLAHLQFLFIRSPCWQGQLPPNLGRELPGLWYLDIGHWSQLQPECGVQGTLPAIWGRTMPNLEVLSIIHNRLTGTLPQEYAQMTKMRTFVLFDNRLSGSLPSSYGSWENIERFELYENNLEGVLPTSYGAWTDIVRLLLSDNNLQGTIPAAWSGLTNTGLRDFALSNNPR